MASLAAKAMRNREARDRLESGLERVARRLGVGVPPPAPTRLFDMDIVPIMEVERFASFVESVEMKLDEMANAEEPPETRETWTMQMLRDYAKEREIEIPAEANKKKDALVAFLEEYESKAAEAGAEANGDDQVADSGDATAKEDSDASADDEVSREDSAPSIAEGPIKPGTGTVLFDSDGRQIIVEPREGSDQQPGDLVPPQGSGVSEEFERRLREAEGYPTTDEAPDLKRAIADAKAGQ